MGTLADNHDDSTPTRGQASRRTVLLGAGVLGAAATATAALTACGSSGSDGAGSGGSNTGSRAASGANLVKSTEIPVGGGKIFSEQQVVVTQPTSGQFKAFSSVCTHQGCQVGSISNGIILCPCHGSEYSITDGSVKRAVVPGQAALPAKQVTVTNGEISVS